METQKIFELLANKVLDSVEGIINWKSAALKIKRLEGNVGFESYYVSSNEGQIDIDTKVNYQTAKAIHKLYEFTQNNPLKHKKWNRAVFTLYPDNQFNMEYIWDQELQDEVDGYNKENPV